MAPPVRAANGVDTSIGAIVRVARQIKFEEMTRQLRELRAATAQPGLNLPSGGPMPGAPRTPDLPVVRAISGVGAPLIAELDDGTRLQRPGQQFVIGSQRWVVEDIAPAAVRVRRCDNSASCRPSRPVLLPVQEAP